ncbi:nmda receptor glutamate-binding chain [Cryptosporidium felis]|nr:nmda receptor glutamate-binding chain [Cryptosporidium felis]
MNAYHREYEFNNNDCDLESQEFNSFSKSVRNGFIRRVYMLVGLQILIDIIVTLSVIFIPQLNHFMKGNSNFARAALLVSIVLTVILYIPMFYPDSCLNNHSVKMTVFFLFTICEAATISLLTSFVKPKYVLLALLITSISVVSLTLFSFQTKYDFTSFSSFLFYSVIGFSIFSLIYLFFPVYKPVEILLGLVGTVLFSFGLVVSTQSVIGSGKQVIYEDDSVMAALLIHCYIIDIFISVLRLILAISEK